MNHSPIDRKFLVKSLLGFRDPLRAALSVGVAASLAGCVTTKGAPTGAQLGEALGKVLVGAPLQPSGTAPTGVDPRRGIRSINESELAGLFQSKPLRMPNGRNAQYPRVAITVVDHFVEQFKLPTPSQCYFMQAKVWESPAKSRDVAPFSVCGKDIQQPPGGFLRADGTLAIWNSGIASAGEDHTGSTRTEGPRFPQRPVPHGPLDGVGITTSDIAYYFVHGTLTAMNFDFTQADPRVWFVRFGKLGAAGIQNLQAAAQQSVPSAAATDARPPVGDAVPSSTTTAVVGRPATAGQSTSGGQPVTGASAAVTAKRLAGPAMTYAAMVKTISDAKGHVPTVRAKLAGRPIQLTLKAPGPQSLVVDVADEIFFRCLQRAPGFRGGKITAVISDYEATESGHGMMVVLESCR